MIGVQICKDIDFFIISQKSNGLEQKNVSQTQQLHINVKV